MSKNMFSALGSDSEDEKDQSVPQPKQTNKTKQRPNTTATQKAKVTNDDFDGTPARGKDSRGRGRGRGDRGRGDRARGERGRGRGDRGRGDRVDRGRGRGRGGYGGEGYTTEDRGGYRGRGRGRGERGRGRGRGDRARGRGGYRGGHRGGHHEEGAYSHLATKEQVLSEEELKANQTEGADEGVEDAGKHGGYDKKSGTGHGREVKKGGAGKGGWGVEDTEHLEHRGAEVAAEIAEGTTPTADEKEGEGEGEQEVEDNKMSYAEYLEKRKQDNANLTKVQARAPEEIKVKNIEKHDGKKTSKATGSSIKSHEAYAPTGIKSDIDLGFGTAPDEEEETSYYDRPQRGGRGRGGRGRGRGGFNDRGRGAQGPKRGRGNKFVAKDDDFPSL